MTLNKSFPTGTLVLFLSFIMLLTVAWLTLSPSSKPVPKELIAVLRPQPVPLRPFTLTDQYGQLFTTERLKQKWSFVFFGYTYCPDICPTTLSTLARVIRGLKKTPEMASGMQIVFVSVDPDRDKPETLARYMEYFGKEFTGLTGFPNELHDFARQFGAAYIKEKEATPGDYLVSHTSSIFLVDPQMRIVAAFSPPHDDKTITDLYRKIHDLF